MWLACVFRIASLLSWPILSPQIARQYSKHAEPIQNGETVPPSYNKAAELHKETGKAQQGAPVKLQDILRLVPDHKRIPTRLLFDVVLTLLCCKFTRSLHRRLLFDALIDNDARRTPFLS